MKYSTKEIIWYSTLFITGFAVLSLFSMQTPTDMTDEIGNSTYGLTGIITAINSEESIVTVSSYDQFKFNDDESFNIELHVRESSHLYRQDIIIEDNVFIKLTEKESIELPALRIDDVVFVTFRESQISFEVKELLVGFPTPVFKEITPQILEGLLPQQVNLQQ